MINTVRRLAGTAAVVAVALGLSAQPAQATTAAPMLSISFVGSITNCYDTSLNDPNINVSFETSGTTSAGYTLITVNLGSAGSFSESVPTVEIEQLVQAISAAGGSLSITIPPEPLGPPGCDIQGTMTLSVDGASGTQVSANAPGNLATTNSQVNSFVQTVLPGISSRIGDVLRGRASGFKATGNTYTISGMAAGDGDRKPIGAWAGYSFSDSRNKFAATAFSSDRHTVLFGVDTMPSENWLLGVSVALERAEVKTRFNRGEQSTTGINLTPYVGILLTDWLTVDAAIGIGSVSNDQFRTAGATRVTSDVESTRVYGSLNATATHAFDRLLVSAHAGLLYATQKDEDFRESNGAIIPEMRTNIGRFLIGGELAYSVGAFEPYVSGTFEHDFNRTTVQFAPGVVAPKNDDSDLLFAVGLRYFGDNDLSGTLEYSTVIGRRYIDEDTYSANVRWKF